LLCDGSLSCTNLFNFGRDGPKRFPRLPERSSFLFGIRNSLGSCLSFGSSLSLGSGLLFRFVYLGSGLLSPGLLGSGLLGSGLLGSGLFTADFLVGIWDPLGHRLIGWRWADNQTC